MNVLKDFIKLIFGLDREPTNTEVIILVLFLAFIFLMLIEARI